MNMCKTVLLTGFLILLGGVAQGGPFETKKFEIPSDSIKILYADIDLAAGEFRAMPDDIAEIFKATTEYDPDRVEVFAEYKKSGSRGHLEVGSDLLSKFQVDTDDNNWDILFSRQYPTDMKLDMGMCNADIDLGGIPLVDLDVDCGAADGKLAFSRPNPQVVENISIEAGAAKFEIEQLGNANFRTLKFEGGVGKFRIDFSGKFTNQARAEISIGLGKAIIFIPDNLPIRIEAEDNFLSSVNFRNASGLRVKEGYYKSDDFDNAAASLDLKIDVGLGSVEIIWGD